MKVNKKIEDIELFVLDMDGTIYIENTLFPYTLDFIDFLKKKNKRFMFFTNNSSKNDKEYIDKLRRLNIDITKDQIMTSGDVTISYLKKYHKEKKIYLLGTKALEDSFQENNIILDSDNPDIVVIGFDTTLTYEKIKNACRFINNGSMFIATHPDVNCPAIEGAIPDCGAMCSMISASTGVRPLIIGKPEKTTIEAIVGLSKVPKENIAIIGDRLYTDVALGVLNDSMGILVLSGETKKEDVDKSDIKPHYVFNNIGEIIDFWRE